MRQLLAEVRGRLELEVQAIGAQLGAELGGLAAAGVYLVQVALEAGVLLQQHQGVALDGFELVHRNLKAKPQVAEQVDGEEGLELGLHGLLVGVDHWVLVVLVVEGEVERGVSGLLLQDVAVLVEVLLPNAYVDFLVVESVELCEVDWLLDEVAQLQLLQLVEQGYHGQLLLLAEAGQVDVLEEAPLEADDARVERDAGRVAEQLAEDQRLGLVVAQALGGHAGLRVDRDLRCGVDDLEVELKHLWQQLNVRCVSVTSSILVLESSPGRGTLLDLRAERVREGDLSILHIKLLGCDGLEADDAGGDHHLLVVGLVAHRAVHSQQQATIHRSSRVIHSQSVHLVQGQGQNWLLHLRAHSHLLL